MQKIMSVVVPLPRVVSQKSSRHIEGHVLVYADDLKLMFHLPLADAAGKIGLCQTTFKKTCRRLGIVHWPYMKKGAKRRSAAYKETEIVMPLPSVRTQSLSAPASSTPWTAQEQDSATNNSAVAPGGMRGVERGAGGECIEAVLDYLDMCEVGGHSDFLFLLQDELVRDGHFASP
ncbi:hypothetical protein T484DRAFT_1920243 [Baffinella frigidus]|nr:hypothetical protein T484DRAFT_1920243 [Cryptophyta sp. CCMP2293]